MVAQINTVEITVRNGRLVLDVETDLPEGSRLRLSLRGDRAENPVVRCDVLLFVATPTERQALRSVSVALGLRCDEVKGRFGSYLDLGYVSANYRVFAVETEMGALGAGGSAMKALLCPIETGARVIVAVGTAFGVERETQRFGDVLVATHVLAYDSVVVDTESDGALPRVRYSPRPVATSRLVRDLLRRYYEALPAVGELNHGVHFGALLSGSAQIRCRAYRDHLRAKFDKRLATLDRERRRRDEAFAERVVGGEMEGVGLLAMPTEEEQMSWSIVKGISDFADERHQAENEEHRRIASENAIRFVLRAFASAAPAEKEGGWR